MDIGLKRPATVSQVIVEVMDVGQVWSATLPLLFAEDVLIVVDLSQKISVTLPLTIREHELVLKGESDIGLRPATIAPITKVNVVYF